MQLQKIYPLLCLFVKNTIWFFFFEKKSIRVIIKRLSRLYCLYLITPQLKSFFTKARNWKIWQLLFFYCW